MKKWFKTKNYQVVNLMNYEGFYAKEEVASKEFHVLGVHCESEDRCIIGIFDTLDEADAYLQMVYEFLCQK